MANLLERTNSDSKEQVAEVTRDKAESSYAEQINQQQIRDINQDPSTDVVENQKTKEETTDNYCSDVHEEESTGQSDSKTEMLAPTNTPVSYDDRHKLVIGTAQEKVMMGFGDLHSFPHTDSADPRTAYDQNTISINCHGLKELILNTKLRAKVAPILLMIAGLPRCGKSALLNALLTGAIHAPQKTSMKSVFKQNDKAGLDYYEFAAIDIPPRYRDTLHYFETNIDSFSIYSFQSCLKGYFSLKKQDIVGFAKFENNQPIFKDDQLNGHFHDVFVQLLTIHEDSSVSCPKDFVSHWDMSISSGLALINVWDFGISKSVFHFLPILCGHLYNSHLWSFFDFERDVPHLDEVPDIPENLFDPERADKDTFMRIRPRVEYLVRSANMASSKYAMRKNSCSLFALCDTLSTEKVQDLNDILAEKLPQATSEAGVAHLTKKGFTLLPKLGFKLGQDPRSSRRILKEELDALVHERLQSVVKIPLSCVFLRSLFYKHTKLYITKTELKVKAEQLGITNEMLEDDFCKVYTSAGSIFDMSLINKDLDYVIVKPMKFLELLDNIFYPSPKKYPNVIKHGIAAKREVQEMFGDDTEFFMDILCGVNLAAKIDSKNVACCPEMGLQESSYYYFVPNARTIAPVTAHTLTAIHLIRYPDSLISTKLSSMFIRAFLKDSPDAKLLFQEPSPVNVTVFKVSDTATFKLIYIRNELEFHLSDNVDISVCQLIIKSCNEMFSHFAGHGFSFKYKFAIACPGIRSEDDEICYHRLPLPQEPECERCKEVDTNSIYHSDLINTWNKAQRAHPIPLERLLNGDFMTMDDMHTIVKLLDPLSPKAHSVLADALNVPRPDYPTGRWRSLYTILCQWELQLQRNDPVCGSKAQLKKYLLKVATDSQLASNEKDKEIIIAATEDNIFK